MAKLSCLNPRKSKEVVRWSVTQASVHYAQSVINRLSSSSSSSSSWQFISLLFSQHKKLNERIKTTSEKGMLVTKRIDVKHTQIF